MQAPSAPAAPDPVATANAQRQSNRDTAVSQYGLNATNQYTPYGSTEYSQNGTWPDGTPRFSVNTNLSPEQQRLFASNQNMQQGMADIGTQQVGRIANTLNTPVNLPSLNLNTDATEARTMELARKRLDPILAQRGEAKKAELFNAGVLPGTEAYRRGMLENSQAANDATNQLILGGHDQAVRDATTEYNAGTSRTLQERNQMFNEIASLLNGSQIQLPGQINTPTAGIAPTDVIGAQQQSLNQQNVGFNAANQRYQGMVNGMFGLGRTALGGWGMGA